MPANHSRLHLFLMRHRIFCFLLMTLSFVLFGALSLDLVRFVRANSSLIWDHGFQALMDGGLEQVLTLWFNAFAAIACYLIFKLCEHVLVMGLASQEH